MDAVVADLLSVVLRRTGKARLKVTGTSMLPAIRPGDVLRIHHTALERIEAGDVVLVAWGGRLLAHRVVEVMKNVAGGSLITRGDNHAHTDPPVSERELLGRVVAIERSAL
jgi:signal peptidase